MTDKLSFPKTEIIRWVFTFCIGVAGAYLTINTQISNINSKLEILELRVEQTNKELTKTSTGISNIPDTEQIANYTDFLNERKAIKEQNRF